MKKKIVLIAAIILCLSILVSCGTDDIDISGYSNETIVLKGLSKENKTVTVAQLKELECTTKKTKSTSDKIGTVRATGPWLSTLLESYGYEQTDFSKIRIWGEDKYDISLSSDFLKDNEIMLAFGIDGEPLKDTEKPVRIIIPESDSAYWIRLVNKIEFVK